METASIGSLAQDVIRRQRDHVFPAVTPYYDEPLVIVEAEGVWAVGADGERYLDMFAGILTTSIGHCHPRVVSAVQDQVARLGHTSTLYVTEPHVEAAEKLTGLAPGGLDKVFFTNSGTEAVETARAERTNPTQDYLLGIPLLADYLEEGLEKLGHSVEDVEQGVL